VALFLMFVSVIFVVFLYDQIEWGSPKRVKTYLASTGSLAEGAPFIVAGRPIGEIESIALAPRGTTKLMAEDGVAITVKLDRDEAERVSATGDVFVTSRGALTVRYLELGPPNGPGSMLVEVDELRGKDPPTLDRVFQRTLDNLNTARQFAEEVRPEARVLGDEIEKLQATMLGLAPEILLADDFTTLFEEARRTYAALGGDPGIARMRLLADQTQGTIATAREQIAKLSASAEVLGASLDVLKARLGSKGAQAIEHVEIAIDRVKAAIAKVDPLLATVADIQQRIERGEGSLLKLARDPEFPEDAKELGKILKRQPWKLLDRPDK
jgi:ABC-type transporter Mla subunit MlaD